VQLSVPFLSNRLLASVVSSGLTDKSEHGRVRNLSAS